MVGLTEAGLRLRGAGGGGGLGPAGRRPLPASPGQHGPVRRLCPDPLEAEDGSWLLSDLVRQPFCGIKA